MVAPPGWSLLQIEALYDQLPIGKRFEQKATTDRGLVPVIDQSSDSVIGWHSEEPGIHASEARPVVTFANHTCEMRVMRRPFSVIQNVFPLVGKTGVCSTEFLYYGTKGRVHLEEYKGHYPDFRRKWIPVPPLGEQRVIARILGALDDKFELNRRMNETLEAMARALFKSWFVDFDPVRAKMRGEQPAGMDAATAALFPSRLVQTEHGEAPEGWTLRPLDSVATFLNGLALQKFPAGDGPSLPVIKIAEMRAGVTAKSDRASTAIPPQYVVEDGDLLFSWSGSLNIIVWTGGRGALNQHLFKVYSPTFPPWFLLGGVRQHLSNFQAIAASKATTMGHIQRHHLTEALVSVPDADVVAHLGRTLAPLHERVVANSQEARTLTTLRDALLPRLLSGELRVPDAERAVAEVA